MDLKLILKDGTELMGESFGFSLKKGQEVDGEVVFNTGMVGYPETFTDPSYRGQILVMTYPMIGNYGVPTEGEAEGVSKMLESTKIHLRGLIISEECEKESHWQAQKTLEAFLKKHKIPAIKGIDTRALTRKLREHGVMLGKIATQEAKFGPETRFEDPNTTNLVAEVSVKKKTVLKPKGKVRATVALMDCGIKHNIIRSFLERGVRVVRLPWNTDLSAVREKYDGVFVSNGPGDPQMADKTVESLRWAMEQNKVIFGICLGSQIMGLAAGGKTYKLKYGHRSANQPCIDVVNNKGQRCYITSQNHGYAVDEKSLPRGWKVWFKNANDGTVEGLRHASKPWFSVQFHPEASPGPEDAAFLF
ncbi:MAG: glutamine-hydrolyzing carbamoyl-phosphate synthase small subunit, partial [Candidatus Peregrinibacteria bacterium]|nr:glutamine-hydrolyzing carbamoyl-phosphate synthase small subunit [Candidatus Peregrinibacteria bacterium]